MSRRIEVELTSTREDGTWTWRAAGAKLPKGDLNGSLLYTGAKVGDVVRADADFMMDGIDIIAVLAPKGARKEAERIEVIGTPRGDDEPLVTTKLAPKGRGGDRKERRPRREGEERGPRREGEERGPRREGAESGERKERRPRPEGEGSQDARRHQGDRAKHTNRPTRPAPETKPKAKRLRAGHTHRNAVLGALPEEQKPIAEQVLLGGIPAVRLAVEKQNETNKAEGKPEISPAPLLTLAEQIMPALRTAEWRDKAEAALAEISELDLRDLRSVVVASDVAARDEETRALAAQLKTALTARVDQEQTAWLAEINELLEGNRSVRALRVSSRPPKAGAPLPAELAAKLVQAAAESLTTDTGCDRYATVLDALAFSPIRLQVIPAGIPAEPTPELIAAVKKVASRLPAIAALFGITSTTGGRKGGPAVKPRPPKPNLAPVATEAPASADDQVAKPADEVAPAAEVENEPVAEVSPEPIAESTEVPEPEIEVSEPEISPNPSAIEVDAAIDADDAESSADIQSE